MKQLLKNFISRYNLSKRDLTILSAAALFLIVVGLLTALTIKISVSKTSSHTFCSSCHSMKPFTEAYLESPHGGNNDVGVRATCVECHLPHDGTIHYLYVKAKLGMHDFLMETFTDTSKIDWNAISKRNHSFVYDSGCLNCHKNLDATSKNLKAMLAHKSYDTQTDGKLKCVSCHDDIGHKNWRSKFKKNIK